MKVTEKIRMAYDQLAESYNDQIDHKPHNAYYDRPNTLGLFDSVKGAKILDAGCGPGKYAEILISNGAYLTGFDLSPKMVEFAQQRNKGQGVFFEHDLSNPLTMMEDNSFDYVLSALNLHYIKDWSGTIAEFCRVLKKNGKLIVSIEHPFYDFNYHKSNQYFETEHVKCLWKGFDGPVEMNSYRRSLQSCIEPLTDNGFYIEKIIEPKPVKKFESLDLEHYRELNAFPAFMCIKAVKK